MLIVIAITALLTISATFSAFAWFPPFCEVQLLPRYICHDNDIHSPDYCNYYYWDENGESHPLRTDASDGLYYDANHNGQYDEGELYWQDSEGTWILMPITPDPNPHLYVPLPPGPPFPPGPGQWWYEPFGIMTPEDTAKFNSVGLQLIALHTSLYGISGYGYDSEVALILSSIYGGLIPDNPENPLDLNNYQVLVQRRATFYPELEQLNPPSGLTTLHSALLMGLSEGAFVALPYQNLDDNTFTTVQGGGTVHLINTNGNTVVYDVYIHRTNDIVSVSGTYHGQQLPQEMVDHPILLLNGILEELLS